MKTCRNFSWLLLTIFLVFVFSVAWGQAAKQVTLLTSGTTTRVSVASDGTEGNSDSGGSSISADGRYVAFSSYASNLVSGDTNGLADIFVHDKQTGQITRVSVASDGTGGNYGSDHPSISADGRYIAFMSYADNLVGEDTNNVQDVFAYDRQTQQTTRISVASDGVEGNDWSDYPSISADGRYVAYNSMASNLVNGDTNGTHDVFLFDMLTKLTTRISIASGGTEGNSFSWHPSISADGRYVAFDSYASNLVSEDTNGVWDVFLHDTQTGQTIRVSIASDSSESNGSSGGSSVSSNGLYVVFSSEASNLDNGEPNWWSDVFIHDIQTGETTQISIASDGTMGNHISSNPSITADGRYVTFNSAASNLVSGDTNVYDDVFVHDRQTGQTTRVSVVSDGTEGNNQSDSPSLSADGRYVVFRSLASNLVIGDTNGYADVFVRDSGGEEFSISGQILDDSNSPVEGVEVSTNTKESDITDANGNYVIPGLSAGTYSVTPAKPGFSFLPLSQNITVPPHAEDVDFTAQQKPVVVLVHGFQGLASNPLNCDDNNINQNPVEIYHWEEETIPNTGIQYAKDYWGHMPRWLENDYDVWIAQLRTSLNLGTAPLGFNGRCLQNQINYVVEHTGQAKVTLIAHSMGGLVSRACLNNAGCRENVDTLITLGSPHAGLPAGGLALILEIDCVLQPGICQMSDQLMPIFNGINTNKKGIDYYFIGGDGSSGPGHGVQKLWYGLGAGPNDALVGKYSAVGWEWPLKWFVPGWWDNDSPPAQYWTDEFHSRAYSFEDGDESKQQIRDDYYHFRYEHPALRSNAYWCFTDLLDHITNPASCSSANNLLQASAQAPALSQPTSIQKGNLSNGQTLLQPLQVDNSGETTFYLGWYTGTLNLSLKRPDGQLIDPAYAASNPSEVAYAAGIGSPETLLFTTYSFTNTLSGEWTLVVDGTTLGAQETDFWAYALLASDRTLAVGIDQPYFAIGNTATLTATLQSSGNDLPGATVVAEILRFDGVTETVLLADQGGGHYAGTYLIPAAPGYLSIAIRAAGDDNGTAFTRQENLLALVAPQNAQFTGTYSDQPEDSDGNGLYEWMHLNADVNVAEAGTYVVSALLVSGDGQLISSVSTDVTLDTGVQTVTLSFDGDDIRTRQLDGPYTITNLQITEINLGIPSQILQNVYVTPAYHWRDFGRSTFSTPVFLPIVIR